MKRLEKTRGKEEGGTRKETGERGRGEGREKMRERWRRKRKRENLKSELEKRKIELNRVEVEDGKGLRKQKSGWYITNEG